MSKELSHFCEHIFSYLNFRRTFNYVVYRYIDCVKGVLRFSQRWFLISRTFGLWRCVVERVPHVSKRRVVKDLRHLPLQLSRNKNWDRGPLLKDNWSNRQQSYQLIPRDFSVIIWNYFLQMAVMVTSVTLHSCATGKHTSGFHSNATRTSLGLASIGVSAERGWRREVGGNRFGKVAWTVNAMEAKRSAVVWLFSYRGENNNTM